MLRTRYLNILFVAGLVARIILISTLIPPYELSNIPGVYAAGVATLANSSVVEFTDSDLELMKSNDMYYTPYTTYWPYLPFANYFRTSLVILSGHSLANYNRIYLFLIILFDILIYLLIQKILAVYKIRKNERQFYALLYFLSPMAIDNLRWRHNNNFMALFLLLAIYLFIKEKQRISSISLSISIGLKILPVFTLPFFIFKSKDKIKFLLLALFLPVITTIPTLLNTPLLFIKNCFTWGGGVHGGDFSHSVQFMSFTTVLHVLGIGIENSAFIGVIFILIMFLTFGIIYYIFKNEDLKFQAFLIFTSFFLFHNIIGSYHFVILHSLFVLNIHRSEYFKKIALPFILLPAGWYFATPVSFGTRALKKLGFTNIPHEIVIVLVILALKVFFVSLLIEAYRVRVHGNNKNPSKD